QPPKAFAKLPWASLPWPCALLSLPDALFELPNALTHRPDASLKLPQAAAWPVVVLVDGNPASSAQTSARAFPAATSSSDMVIAAHSGRRVMLAFMCSSLAPTGREAPPLDMAFAGSWRRVPSRHRVGPALHRVGR